MIKKILLLLLFYILSTYAKIYDPLNIFCGSDNCYDILEVPREASLATIKKSFRKLSLQYHPDKNDAANATEIFRKISKASEVLTNEESRELFNYYLDHPRDYYKVSGSHYIHTLPKVSVAFIAIIVLSLLSALTYYNQLSRYNKVKKFLITTSMQNLTLQNGGTKETIEIHNQAVAKFNEEYNKKKKMKIAQIMADKNFEKIVTEIVEGIKIEGGHRKPTINDLFVLKLVLFPYTIYKNFNKLYRRHYAKDLTDEEKLEFTIDTLGLATWHNIEEEEREEILKREIWIEENFLTWKEEKEEELRKKLLKTKKRLKRKYNINDSDLSDLDIDDYVE